MDKSQPLDSKIVFLNTYPLYSDLSGGSAIQGLNNRDLKYQKIIKIYLKGTFVKLFPNFRRTYIISTYWMTTRVLAIYSYQVAMLIVSLAAARAGVMQYSLPPWTRMHNKRSTICNIWKERDWTSDTSNWTSPDKTLSSNPPTPLPRPLRGL